MNMNICGTVAFRLDIPDIICIPKRNKTRFRERSENIIVRLVVSMFIKKLENVGIFIFRGNSRPQSTKYM